MSKVVIIACAGWKGAGRGTEFVNLPAPFLPIREGLTCASDLAGQFQALGYDVVLTAGPVGYPFKAYQPRHRFRHEGMSSMEAAQVIGVDPEDSPWTEELHETIRMLGTLIVQPSPGWKSKHDSYCVALKQIGQHYDQIVLARGDKIYNPEFLRQIVETLPWPSQFSLETFHSFFMLDRRGAFIYRNDARAHRWRSRAKQNWGMEMAKQPDGGEGTGRLDRAGIAHFGWHTPPWDEVRRDGLWFNIDQPEGYAEARRRIAEGELPWS